MMTKADDLAGLAATAEDIVIVAPYIKQSALQHILSDCAHTANIVCATRWTVPDVLSGASDIEARQIILDRRGEFRLHARLHAKYFRFADHVLVGSANVTASALGLSDTPNVEILCEPSASFDAAAFEREVIRDSHIIGDAEARIWEALVKLLPPTITPLVGRDSNLEAWLPVTREPAHVWLTYQGRQREIPSTDERRLAAIDLAELRLPDGLDRPQFDALLAGRLLSSSRVDDVRRLADLEEVAAWDELGRRWAVTRRDALRARSTVENWLAEFLE